MKRDAIPIFSRSENPQARSGHPESRTPRRARLTQWRGELGRGRSLPPFPSLPLFVPFPSFPFFSSSLPFASLRSRTPKIQVGGLGSAVSSPSGPVGSGAEPQPKSNLVHKIVALTYEIWWQVGNSFNYLPENQLTKLAHLVQFDKLTYA